MPTTTTTVPYMTAADNFFYWAQVALMTNGLVTIAIYEWRDSEELDEVRPPRDFAPVLLLTSAVFQCAGRLLPVRSLVVLLVWLPGVEDLLHPRLGMHHHSKEVRQTHKQDSRSARACQTNAGHGAQAP